MSSPPTTPMSQASTKFGQDSSTSLDDAKRFRRGAIDRLKDGTTSRDVLLFLIAFRILNALSISSFFQPDEFFQSLEPAWEIAFGADSGAWITWEWKNRLRSAVHPALFAAIFWACSYVSGILRFSPTFHADLLIAAPKMTQAVFAALGDYYTWKLGERVYGGGSNEAWAVLALTVGSPWQWFCSTRTLSNCLETTLTVVALNFWPWQWSMKAREDEDIHEDSYCESESEDENQDPADEPAKSISSVRDDINKSLDGPSGLRRSLLLAALACILRPTNLLIWICFACFILFRITTHGLLVPLPWNGAQIWINVASLSLLPATGQQRIVLLRDGMLCGSLILILSSVIDRLYYQQWTFPPLRFLYFNIAQSIAIFYGKNDWHYYLSQGYPLLLTTFLPFALHSIHQSLFPPSNPPQYSNTSLFTKSIRYQLATTALLVPAALSLISHKEVRFIYPLLPLLHILSASSFTAFFLPAISPVIPPTPSTLPKRLLLTCLLITNVAIALFATTAHQIAPLSVITYLRDQHITHYLTQPPTFSSLPPASSTMTVGFLMPCHSTPWRSHLVHPSIKAWALTCEPPIGLNTTARVTYVDEADIFYADPTAFLTKTLGRPPPPRRDKTSRLRWLTAHRSEKGSFTKNQTLTPTAWDGREGRKAWPEYVVFFQQLEPTIQDVLRGSAYRECWRGWNSFGHDDWRRRGDIVVWCLRSNGEKRSERRGWGWGL